MGGLMKFSLRWVFGLIACCAIVTLVGVLLVNSAWWNGGVAPVQFVADQWKSNRDVGDGRTIRSAMIDDLLDRYDFRGWSRSKVESLLGAPDVQQTNSTVGDWDMVYKLGYERAGPFSLDVEYLVFRTNAKDEVIDARLVVH